MLQLGLSLTILRMGEEFTCGKSGKTGIQNDIGDLPVGFCKQPCRMA